MTGKDYYKDVANKSSVNVAEVEILGNDGKK
jgi:hypothetical protein